MTQASHLATFREAFTAKCGLNHLSSSTQQCRGERQGASNQKIPSRTFRITTNPYMCKWDSPKPEAKANSRSTHPFCSIHKAKEGIFDGKTLKSSATKMAGHCPKSQPHKKNCLEKYLDKNKFLRVTAP